MLNWKTRRKRFEYKFEPEIDIRKKCCEIMSIDDINLKKSNSE